MRDNRVIDDREKAGQEAEAGTQYRRDHGRGRNSLAHSRCDGRYEAGIVDLEIARRFERKEGPDLFNEAPEHRNRRRPHVKRQLPARPPLQQG